MAKKKPFDSLLELADHYDQIRGTNGNLSEQQILEIVAKATGNTLSNVKKRWKLMQSIDWPIIDYIERGVIGMTRAMVLLDHEMTREERTKIMDESLDKNISDSDFKEYLARYIEKREEAAAQQA
jgi:benzoyl-CoA reductase/2-hydroxyglutaryl-CoA dehydratase subunit BcrC/BadD/HgdB